VVRGRVGVVERDAIEVDVVIAVLEAAEEGLALAEADAVGALSERAGNDLDDLPKSAIGDVKFSM
jgi:hypothetical protein